MPYSLFIADKAFSSWSLRGWLMFEKFGIPYVEKPVGLYDGRMGEDLQDLYPARLVPVMKTPDGIVIGDTLAMAETLAERHPDADLWPVDPAARGLARWMVAEMHSGYTALRGECPMQLLRVYEGFVPTEAVAQDLARLTDLWATARKRHGKDGPWLFGAYSLADVFFAPVAARITGYDLPVDDSARDYVNLHLNDPAFRTWRREGLKVSYENEPYALNLPSREWPVAD